MKCYNINTFEDVDLFIFNINENIDIKLKLKNKNLKYYLFSKVQEYCNIINCNSSIERFYEDLQNKGIIIFDNINLCRDEQIIKIVENTKGIVIWN